MRNTQKNKFTLTTVLVENNNVKTSNVTLSLFQTQFNGKKDEVKNGDSTHGSQIVK